MGSGGTSLVPVMCGQCGNLLFFDAPPDPRGSEWGDFGECIQ
jgi:hypothetical protein